jgi:PLP dependent protein
MSAIAARLQTVRDRIAHAAQACGRRPDEVRLLAVSKTFPASSIEEAYACGQRAFGESYAHEGVRKVTLLAGRQIEWHFIGPIQSNKTRLIAGHFHWVHSVDRERVAIRLNAARPAHLPALNVCIQVNISGEPGKSGVAPGDERRLAEAIAELPALRLRGLMAIPEPTPDTRLQRERYARLRDLKQDLVAAGYALDTLSMGMSGDLEAAVAEGATIVRVGTAIFGPRSTGIE